LLVSGLLAGCASGPGGADHAGGAGSVSAGGAGSVSAGGAGSGGLAAARATLRACPQPARPATGDPALPDLTLPCLGNGPAVALRRLAGTPTVINLWASWCGPCRAELPAFEQVQDAAGGRLRVLGVVHEDPAGRALSLAVDTGVHFPSVVDEAGRLLRALGRQNMPTTVFVDAGGRVVEVYTGAPFTAETLRQRVLDRLGIDVG